MSAGGNDCLDDWRLNYCTQCERLLGVCVHPGLPLDSRPQQPWQVFVWNLGLIEGRNKTARTECS